MARIKVVTESHVYGDDTQNINYVSPAELDRKLSKLKETISTLRSDVRAEVRELRKSAGEENPSPTAQTAAAPETRDEILRKMREEMMADLIKMLEPLYMKIAAMEDAAATSSGGNAGSRKKTEKTSGTGIASGGETALREIARWKVDLNSRLDVVEKKIQFLSQEIELLKKKRR